MSRDFDIIQLDLDPEAFKRLPNRQRNQLVGCMHAHNELVVLNRLLMFSLNDVGEGELHNDAQGVQMWTILQVLTGKLFETWNLIAERFLGSNPEDPTIVRLSEAPRASAATSCFLTAGCFQGGTVSSRERAESCQSALKKHSRKAGIDTQETAPMATRARRV